MKILRGGNVHKTYLDSGKIRQILNPNYHIRPKEYTNKIVSLLKENGIVASVVLSQSKTERISEFLEGKFYDNFSEEQCIKAIRLIKKIHIALSSFDGAKEHPIKDYRYGNDIVFGDVKANNILWRNKEPVGIVDYDTVGTGYKLNDVFFGIILWQKNFNLNTATKILKEYGDYPLDFQELFGKFVLLKIKEISTQAMGLGYFKPKPKKYYINRIKQLNSIYDKSLNWRIL